MARIYLVDAFNVMHAEPPLARLLRQSGPAAAGDALIGLIRRWVESHPRPPEVVLVFDGPGPPPGRRTPNLEVRFRDHQADDDLVELLERRGNRFLVSHDGELVRAAGNLGCPVIKPREFLADVRGETQVHTELAAREHLPGPAEVDGWLEAFGQPRPRPVAAEPPLDDVEVDGWLDYFQDES